MNRLLLICGFAVAVLWIAVVSADPPNEQADTVTIPLDQIWAYHMRGTLDVNELEPEQSPEHLQTLSPDEQRDLLSKRLVNPIALSVCADSSPHWPRKGQIAGPGFAVSGISRDALQATYDVMAKGKKPSDTFTSESEISLVFFSYQCGAFVELQSVERSGNLFTIQYRFIRPLNKIQSAHFALIPVGKLAAGHYEVEVKQRRTGQEQEDGQYGRLNSSQPDKPKEEAWGHRLISGSFSFDVLRDER